MDLQAHVTLEAEARDDEVAAVAAAFAEAGIPAEVRVDPMLKGAGGEYPWLVVLLSIPPTAFLTTFASEAAKDAYKNLKELIKRLYDARKGARASHGGVTLVDEETGTWTTLPPELTDEVWRQLREAPNELPSGTFKWDPTTGQWRKAYGG